LLMKLKLEHELKVGRASISGSSLMPVTDMIVVDTLTSQQLRIVKYTVTKLLIGLLADQSIITQVQWVCVASSHVPLISSKLLIILRTVLATSTIQNAAECIRSLDDCVYRIDDRENITGKLAVSRERNICQLPPTLPV